MVSSLDESRCGTDCGLIGDDSPLLGLLSAGNSEHEQRECVLRLLLIALDATNSKLSGVACPVTPRRLALLVMICAPGVERQPERSGANAERRRRREPARTAQMITRNETGQQTRESVGKKGGHSLAATQPHRVCERCAVPCSVGRSTSQGLEEGC